MIGLSLEPLLEQVYFPGDTLEQLDWIVVGGESGPHRRPFDPEWLYGLAEACDLTRTPLFIKQDSGPKSGMQGRIPDELWSVKQYPEVRK